MQPAMIKDYFLYYLIGINVLSFLLFLVDRFRHDQTGRTIQPAWIFSVITIIGGSVGTNLYFLFFFPSNKKPKRMKYDQRVKDNQDYYRYWRVFALVMLIIHIVVCLYIYLSPGGQSFRINLVTFVSRYWILLIYLAVINVISFLVYAWDKRQAIKGRFRVRELVLFLLAFIGGALGGITAMIITKHKVRKQAFAVGLPLILLAHLVVMVYLILTTSP